MLFEEENLSHRFGLPTAWRRRNQYIPCYPKGYPPVNIHKKGWIKFCSDVDKTAWWFANMDWILYTRNLAAKIIEAAGPCLFGDNIDSEACIAYQSILDSEFIQANDEINSIYENMINDFNEVFNNIPFEIILQNRIKELAEVFAVKLEYLGFNIEKDFNYEYLVFFGDKEAPHDDFWNWLTNTSVTNLGLYIAEIQAIPKEERYEGDNTEQASSLLANLWTFSTRAGRIKATCVMTGKEASDISYIEDELKIEFGETDPWPFFDRQIAAIGSARAKEIQEKCPKYLQTDKKQGIVYLPAPVTLLYYNRGNARYGELETYSFWAFQKGNQVVDSATEWAAKKMRDALKEGGDALQKGLREAATSIITPLVGGAKSEISNLSRILLVTAGAAGIFILLKSRMRR